MEQKTSLLELMEYIHPAELDYQEWVNVGMALKHEGYSVSDWDHWSRQDSGRYHTGECERKWNTFRGNASPVTGGTIFQMAVEHGFVPERGHEIDWEDSIAKDSDRVVVDGNWIEEREVHEPITWNPVSQLIQYLEILFEPGENVGYVTKSWKNEKEKYVPQDRGNYDRTAGQLIKALSECDGDIGSVFGDYDPEGGAWIRFNPLDGQGVRNENVSDFRYALVESDVEERCKESCTKKWIGYAEKSTEECADRYGNSSKKHHVGNEGFRKNGRSRANSGLWCVCGTGYQIYECTALFETGIQ